VGVVVVVVVVDDVDVGALGVVGVVVVVVVDDVDVGALGVMGVVGGRGVGGSSIFLFFSGPFHFRFSFLLHFGDSKMALVKVFKLLVLLWIVLLYHTTLLLPQYETRFYKPLVTTDHEEGARNSTISFKSSNRHRIVRFRNAFMGPT